MKKMINRVNLQGYLYDHKLSVKVAGPQSKNPGVQFINGDIYIATDSELTNVITVHYTYVTPTTKSGSSNRTFGVLNDIINGKLKTAMADGAENAAKLEINTALDLNDFYVNRNGNEELVSARRNEGGFVTVISNFNENPARTNEFEVDMVINGTREIEADEERGLPYKLILKGCIFNFQNAMLPIEFSVVNPKAIDYFMSLDPSPKNCVFTRLRGKQISETVVTKTEEANAFGETYIREVPRSRKDFVITWGQSEPYLWDDESTITAAEMQKAMADRETYLAQVKHRREEYLASRENNNTTTATTTDYNNGFNF